MELDCCLGRVTSLWEICHLCFDHGVGVVTAPSVGGTESAMFAPMAVAPRPTAVHDLRLDQLEVGEHRCGL